MTIPDSPALDLDALRKQVQLAEDWAEYGHPNDPNWPGMRTLLKRLPELINTVESQREALRLSRTQRNDEALQSLQLSNELAAMTHNFRRSQAENDRVHAKVREQYDVIEHAKKQRNEAIEQAKQAQAERDEAWAWLPYEMRCTLTAKWAEQRGTTPAAATDDGEPEDPSCLCHPEPVPAGGEDGSGTADGNREVTA